MFNELNEKGIHAIAELRIMIRKAGYLIDDSITFDNNQSAIRVCKKNDTEGTVIFESYFPIEVFKFLKENEYLTAI